MTLQAQTSLIVVMKNISILNELTMITLAQTSLTAVMKNISIMKALTMITLEQTTLIVVMKNISIMNALTMFTLAQTSLTALMKNRPDGDDQSWWRRYVEIGNDHTFFCTLRKYKHTSMSVLKRHVSAVHLGFKPCTCKYCNLSAMDTSSVRRHIEKKHPGLNFGFVRRKYSERECDGAHSSGASRRSTAVGRRNTSQRSLSINRAAAIAAAIVMGERYRSAESGLTDASLAQTDVFTEVKQRSLNVEPGLLLSDPALNIPQHTKSYKCIYCDFCSEDRLCDVRDHIFVSHLRRNRFTCVHCAFGSMTKDDVAAHCLDTPSRHGTKCERRQGPLA